jgi:hypothetical protein
VADVDTGPLTSPDRVMRGPVPSRLEAEIDALQSRSLEELRTLWRQLYKTPAPRFFRRELLIRAIAYQMQAKVYGGLSAKTRRTLLKISERAESAGGFTAKDAPRRLRPGTRLIRAYKGVTHTVHVLDDGFEWNGKRYKSLSAIAREITGTSWNGNVFFGLGGKERSDA